MIASTPHLVQSFAFLPKHYHHHLSIECLNDFFFTDVTLFTEALPSDQWHGASAAVQNLRRGDIMLIIGTSSVVYPAASLPERASLKGVTLIEINPDEKTPLANLVHLHLRGGAADVLPQLVDLVLQDRNS